MKIAIITSQSGTKGSILDPSNGGFPNADYYAFTDKQLDLKVWNTKPLHSFSTHPDFPERRNAKLAKMLGWMLIPGYDYYIWQDSTSEVQVDPELLINTFLGPNTDLVAWKHPHRDCSYFEAISVLGVGKDQPEPSHACQQFLKNANWPEHGGLYEMSSFIYRNSFKVQQALLAWFELVSRFSSRDQILFPYVVHKHDLKLSFLPGTAMAYGGNNRVIPQVR